MGVAPECSVPDMHNRVFQNFQSLYDSRAEEYQKFNFQNIRLVMSIHLFQLGTEEI